MHEEWWNHGKLNRTDGPAIEIEQEGLRRCEYWVEGRMHREDGPAFELTQTAMKQVVDREWLTDNKRHRMDGPAIECASKLLSPTVQWPEVKPWSQSPQPWKTFPNLHEGPLCGLLSCLWQGYAFSSHGDFGVQPCLLADDLPDSATWVLRDYEKQKKAILDKLLSNDRITEDNDRIAEDNDRIAEDSTCSILDLLGTYTPETQLIELYLPNILHCALLLDKNLTARADSCVMTLVVMVFIHELGHAVDHANAIKAGTPFPTTPAKDEAFAQRFTWEVIERYAPRALMVFEELEKHQPSIYQRRNWGKYLREQL